MDTDEVRRFETMLVTRRDELIAQGDIKLAPNRTDPGATPDEDEQPLNEMNQVIASKRNKDRALEIRRVEGALARLREAPDDFGYCAHCDDPIAPKRLQLLPWSLYCVRCAEERDGGRRGGARRHLRDFSD